MVPDLGKRNAMAFMSEAAPPRNECEEKEPAVGWEAWMAPMAVWTHLVTVAAVHPLAASPGSDQ
eukprot:CAMPEP_0117661844 /NCGR_PEP_ID=MMETSP0804-20121206/7750_1 /TAXON_ID=1074897 /ORGANISM="Tetraselmis astigmatica, Strain CCMP880" /LENGTH=63 /DNA_ID=CAMNT_0005468731 /DNA_START=85 /DNA_END=277 /DNA_ORIENTATION=-